MNITIKKHIFNIYFLSMFVITSILLMPSTFSLEPNIGLDPSWKIAINLAVQNNFRFGEDLIFNYGPLGYLSTRLPIGVSKYQYLFWDLFILIHFIYIYVYIFKQQTTYLPIGAIFLATLILNTVPIQRSENVLSLVFIFMISHYLKHNHLMALISASLISLVLFYLKVNMGLILFFFIHIIFYYMYFYSYKNSRSFVIAYSGIYLLSWYVMSVWLNTNLITYVKGSLYIIDSYNDAMFLKLGSTPKADWQFLYMALTVITAFIAALLISYKQLIQDGKLTLQVVITSVFLFVTFKHSFVRADGHVISLFHTMPAAIGLLCLFTTQPLQQRLFKVFIVALIFSFPLGYNLYTPDYFFTRVTNIMRYASDFQNYEANLSIKNPQIQSRKLPNSILTLIGQKTVDVIPWEVSYIYANDLNYNPRSTINTFTAYNDYLDTKNYEKYMSTTAPDFILFTVKEIDNRHPFFTESKTKLALLTRYKVIYQDNEFLLLYKQKQNIEYDIKNLSNHQAKLGEFFPLEKTNELQFLSADIDYNTMGLMARTFFQPPILTVTVRLEDGTEHSYRAIKSIISGEVLINKFIDSNEAAKIYFDSGGSLSQNVTEVKFETTDTWGFNQAFNYRLKVIKLNNAPHDLSILPYEITKQLTLTSLDKEINNNNLIIKSYWQVTSLNNSLNYTIFAHLTNEQNERIVGTDISLNQSSIKLLDSHQFELIHILPLPKSTPSGMYNIIIGIYQFQNPTPINSITFRDDFFYLSPFEKDIK